MVGKTLKIKGTIVGSTFDFLSMSALDIFIINPKRDDNIMIHFISSQIFPTV